MDTSKDNKGFLVETLALWLGTPGRDVAKAIDIPQEKISYLYELLEKDPIAASEWYFRKLLYIATLMTKERDRYFLTDAVKRLRQMSRKDLIEINKSSFVKLYLALLAKLRAQPILWKDQKRSCVCLTHDIDSRACYEFIPHVLELERQYRCPATFNFLTAWGYTPDQGLLRDISSRGSEVGLHGRTHDIALGGTPKRDIKDQLSRAREALGMPIRGFRAPALAISRNVLEVLCEIGIEYDSSMKSLSCYGQGAETCFPYIHKGIPLWEVPLTIQDDRIFRDLHLSAEEGLGVFKELILRIHAVGGVSVINTHPRILAQKETFFKEFLAWLSAQDGMWVTTTQEVVACMKNRKQEVAHHGS